LAFWFFLSIFLCKTMCNKSTLVLLSILGIGGRTNLLLFSNQPIDIRSVLHLVWVFVMRIARTTFHF
jgi:hypothetical protein